jgi:hypothetical protein
MHVAMRSAFGFGVAVLMLVAGSLGVSGCSGKEKNAADVATAPAASPAGSNGSEAPLPPLAFESALPESVRA